MYIPDDEVNKEMNPISRKEVARLAGVSEATVSRVFNQVGPLREETIARVMEAAKQLQYVPNALAQRLARRKSGNVGVVMPMVPKVRIFSTYYFSEILSGIGQAINDAGYDLLLMFRNAAERFDYQQLFRTQKVDACIVLGGSDDKEEQADLAALQQAGNAICLINQRVEPLICNTVEADHRDGSIQAVSHLLDQGYRRIAFINGPMMYSNSRDRMQGYLAAMERPGIKGDTSWIYVGNYSRTSGYKLAERIGRAIKAGHIEAVFAGNDRMAIGLQQGLREQGLIAGTDYGLVGYDDSDSSRYTEPLLTTVAVPFFTMGELGTRRVLEQLEGNGEARAPFYEKLPVELVVRASSQPKPPAG